MHLNSIVSCLAQDVNHLAHDILRLLRRPLRNAHHGLVARLATLEFLLWHHDVMNKDIALGDEESEVALYLQLSHESVAGMGKDFGNHRLLDMVLPTCHERHAHAVAIEGKHRIALGHKHGFATIVGQETVLAVGLATEHALLHLSLGVQAVALVRYFAQRVIPRHLLHEIDGQHTLRMGIKMQRTEHLFVGESLVGLSFKKVV